MIFNWFRAIVLIAILGLLAVAGFYWFETDNSGVDFGFDVAEAIVVGKPFDIFVNVVNDSGNVLADAKLTLALPEGVVLAGEPEEKNVSNKILGDVGVGGTNSQGFKLIVLMLKTPEL